MTGMVVAKPSPLTDPPAVPPFRDRIVAVWRAALALRLGLHPDLGHQCHVFGTLAEASFTFAGAVCHVALLDGWSRGRRLLRAVVGFRNNGGVSHRGTKPLSVSFVLCALYTTKRLFVSFRKVFIAK